MAGRFQPALAGVVLHAVSQAPIAFGICDARRRAIFLNDAARRLIGIGAGGLPASALDRLLCRDADIPAIAARLAETGAWEGRLHFRPLGRSETNLDVYVQISRVDLGSGEAGMVIAASERQPPAMAPPLTDAELIERSPRLTPREREVMLGLLRGGTNKSIGIAMKISPRTVEFHRARMMRRFNAGSLIELIRNVAHDVAGGIETGSAAHTDTGIPLRPFGRPRVIAAPSPVRSIP